MKNVFETIGKSSRRRDTAVIDIVIRQRVIFLKSKNKKKTYLINGRAYIICCCSYTARRY